MTGPATPWQPNPATSSVIPPSAVATSRAPVSWIAGAPAIAPTGNTPCDSVNNRPPEPYSTSTSSRAPAAIPVRSDPSASIDTTLPSAGRCGHPEAAAGTDRAPDGSLQPTVMVVTVGSVPGGAAPASAGDSSAANPT